MDIVEYKGWKNNLRLANADAELVITLDVGPRIISYSTPGGFNVLKNYEEMMGGTGESEWQIRGGHRFWIAPEDLTRTYYPDNAPVAHEATGPLSVRLTPPPETKYGIQKVMEVSLAPTGSRVTITLRVTNIGTESTELAPWGPTVMAPGGIEIVPLPAKYDHPGHPDNAASPKDYAPNQNLILWPYFDFADTRWSFGSKYIFLRQDRTKSQTKIGLAHRMKYVAYLNEGCLFVKWPPYVEGATYPDTGTSYQTFSNEDMLEMETCGVLTTLAPGESAEFTECWDLFAGVPPIASEADADRILPPLLESRM